MLREAGPSGSAPARRPAVTPAAPARRPAVTPAARSRSRAPLNWEVTEEEEDFLEQQVRPPSHVLACCLLCNVRSVDQVRNLSTVSLQEPRSAVEGKRFSAMTSLLQSELQRKQDQVMDLLLGACFWVTSVG